LLAQEDRNYYRGGKNAAGEREGIGRVELPAGDIYMGEWKKNLVRTHDSQ
jgi:hypothetical protein